MAGKLFFLVHTFNDISKLGNGKRYYSDIEKRHNIPWRLCIFKKEGFLGLNLHCETKECFEKKKWSFQTKFTMKLVAVSGKFFRRTVQYEFQKPEGHGMDKFISWENMLRDYVDNDSIIIEIHANIVRSTGFFERKYFKYLQPNSDDTFVLKHTFKNISRFLQYEADHSDSEEHFNIPWRVEIRKLNEFLAIYLLCEQEICEERSIECVLEFRLISASGKSYSDQCDSVVKMESSWGNHYFIRWNEMEKEYVQNDSICLEAHVLVINVTDKPRDIAHAEKTFVLSDTVKNMSRIKEGWFYNTKIQNRFNIPWRLQIQRRDGFVGLCLYCLKLLDESRKWSIEIEFQLKIVSTNGRRLLCRGTYVIENPISYQCLMIIRWDSLEKKYIVNNTLTLEAHVEILNMTGIDDENIFQKPSGFTIPVGDKEYSMEKWLEMAFDH
eukprot:NP_494115.3 MATH (meprin-associated Traf homology) domain containing [Caenorhabditis elegans]